MRPDWPAHAMNLAFAAALRSAEAVQVGACLLDRSGVVLGVGYNGPPSRVEIPFEDDNRDGRRPYIIHAEANALRYVTPDRAAGGLLAITHYPCAPCLTLARSYGVARIEWEHEPDWDRYPVLHDRFVRSLGIELERAEP